MPNYLGTPIPGATDPDYVPTGSDVGQYLFCDVTATNSEGSTTTSSNLIGPIAAAPTVFDDAIGVWYADEYQSSPRPQILNTNSAVAASANLLTASRRLFDGGTYDAFWLGSSTTVVDDAVTAPDGSTEASTLVGVGNWLHHPRDTHSLPDGTYTMACNVKRNTGSNQQFCFSKDNTATRSAVKTATSAWQRFSYTFTYDMADTRRLDYFSLCSIDGATDANLQICDFEIYAGSSDLGPTSLAGHLLLGTSAADTRPTYASGALDLSSTGVGLIQFPEATTISSTGITAIAIVSKVASETYGAFLSKVQNYQHFSGISTIADKPADFKASFHNPVAGLWDLQSLGDYHGITHRYDGTNRDLWIDDVRLFRKASTVSDFSIRDFYVGVVASIALPSGLKIAGMALWDRALSDAEVREAYATLAARASDNGLTATPVSRVLVADGDSISALDVPVSYTYKFGSHDSPQVIGNVVAVSGSGLSDVLGRATMVDGIIPDDTAGRKFIYSCLLGANDLLASPPTGHASVAAWVTALGDMFADRKAAGFVTVGATVLPSTDGSINTNRATANPLIVGLEGTDTDDTVDFAADGTMGPDAAASDTDLYPDGKHPSDTGMANLEVIYRPVINGL